MGNTNSNFFRASLNAKSAKGFFMAAICWSTRGAHVGLKSYMAGTRDQARVVLSSNSRKSPAAWPVAFDHVADLTVNATHNCNPECVWPAIPQLNVRKRITD
jgi:hypothetical protein